MTTDRPTPVVPIVILATACLALAGISALDARLVTTVHGTPLTWAVILSATSPRWIVLAAALPLIFHITWRRPPWPRTAKATLLHVALFLGLTLVNATVYSAFLQLAGPLAGPFGFGPRALRAWFSNMPSLGFMYGTILLTAWGIEQARERAARSLRAAQLEAQLHTARLAALRAQLHPHFLYNTLNGIAALVADLQPQRAVMAIEQLAELLHAAFRDDGREAIALSDEVALAERYLALQQLRFGDRLKYTVRVDPMVAECQVPVLILQPVIENAVLHGLTRGRGVMAVSLHASLDEGFLLITIENDGDVLAKDWQPAEGAGIGLNNTRARLVTSFGTSAALHVTRRDGGGVFVRMRIPMAGASAVHEPQPSREQLLQPA
jgi:two-component system, LytTR family, sensor kinase